MTTWQDIAKANVAVYEPIKLGDQMAQGSLNVVAQIRPDSVAGAACDGDAVTLDITARDASGDVDAHNGLVTVTYDAARLELTGVVSHADLKTVVTAEGSLKIAYADLSGFAAGEAAATVTFRALTAEPATVTIAHGETADAFPNVTETFDLGCPSARFEDVSVDAWFHDAVDHVVKAGLMNGVSATAFDPEGELNRAQIVTILYRMAASPAVEAPADFVDVPAGEFYTEAVAWAVAKGITNGISDTSFDPNGTVTREQLVTFLYRYMKTTGADLTAGSDLSGWEDAGAVSAWALEAFGWAVSSGVITGMTETTLEPGSTTNRAQTAVVLMRLAN